MDISSETYPSVRNRLARAHGQLAAVIRMLDEGADCEKVINQLAACSRALDRAGFSLIAGALQQCMLDPSSDMDATKLEKLFLSLS